MVKLITALIFCGLFIQSFNAIADLRIQVNSRVVYSETRQVENYLIALGTYKKVSGRWQVNNERRYTGLLERKTIEVDKFFKARESFYFYRDQLLPGNSRELFFCAKRQCGSSNVWANTHFKISQLYGNNQDQYYGVYAWQKNAQAPVRYLTLYSVRRGNGRVYVQMDMLTPKTDSEELSSTSEAIVKQWQDYGTYSLSKLQVTDASVALPTEQLAVIKKAFLLRPQSIVAVVGHDYTESSQALRLDLSKRYATDIANQLISQGIDSKRLQVHGLGDLAPSQYKNNLYRVELVIVQ